MKKVCFHTCTKIKYSKCCTEYIFGVQISYLLLNKSFCNETPCGLSGGTAPSCWTSKGKRLKWQRYMEHLSREPTTMEETFLIVNYFFSCKKSISHTYGYFWGFVLSWQNWTSVQMIHSLQQMKEHQPGKSTSLNTIIIKNIYNFQSYEQLYCCILTVVHLVKPKLPILS